MAVPKKKTTKKRRGDRRAHWRLRAVELVACPECGNLGRPHRVCAACGYYKGQPAIAVESPEEKAERKKEKAKGRPSRKKPSKPTPREPIKPMRRQPRQPLSVEELSRRPSGDR